MRTQGSKSTVVVAADKVAAPVVKVWGTGVLASGANFYLVNSASDPTHYYVVEQLPTHLGCTCKDHFYRNRRCKHILAVLAHKERLQLEAIQRETAAIVADVRESLGALADVMTVEPEPEPQSQVNRTRPFAFMAK